MSLTAGGRADHNGEQETEVKDSSHTTLHMMSFTQGMAGGYYATGRPHVCLSYVLDDAEGLYSEKLPTRRAMLPESAKLRLLSRLCCSL